MSEARLDSIVPAPATTPSELLLGPEHALRRDLAHEVHSRPPEALETPSRATYLAVLTDRGGRDREVAHLAALCDRFLVDPPVPNSTHFSTRLGSLRGKWERHGEFSSYTFIAKGLSPLPFSDPPARMLPSGWLAAVPGRVLVAAHAKIIGAPRHAVDADFLARHFAANIVVGSDVGESAGSVYTDFRVHEDGFTRFLLIDRCFTARQAGRMMQRLFEIEAYRMMALLALPVARELASQVGAAETNLAALTEEIATGLGDEESLLHRITALAAEVESALASNQFRFGATRAYSDLVDRRIAELREQRLHGVQPIGEFTTRRFGPAVATCSATLERLQGLSERVGRTSTLLSTRVGIARERQNQALLASMDRRAKLQLRLQQTVEGLSVAAIVYYVAGLVGYVAKALRERGADIQPDLIVGVSVPLIAVLVLVATHIARRRIFAQATNS
jgi:uncharacterized membrane-anchored protein